MQELSAYACYGMGLKWEHNSRVIMGVEWSAPKQSRTVGCIVGVGFSFLDGKSPYDQGDINIHLGSHDG